MGDRSCCDSSAKTFTNWSRSALSMRFSPASSMSTFTPFPDSFQAISAPATPVPMMTTSYVSFTVASVAIASSPFGRILPVAVLELRVGRSVGADHLPEQATVEFRLLSRPRLAIRSNELGGVPDGNDLVRQRAQGLVFHDAPLHLEDEVCVLGDRGKGRKRVRDLRGIFVTQALQIGGSQFAVEID